MSGLTQLPSPPAGCPARASGEVRFVSAEERMSAEPCNRCGWLLGRRVPPPPPMVRGSERGPAPRGRLREAIEAAVETALHASGAPSPGVSDMVDLDQCLSDQLFRARSVGAAGFALYLPPLRRGRQPRGRARRRRQRGAALVARRRDRATGGAAARREESAHRRLWPSGSIGENHRCGGDGS